MELDHIPTSSELLFLETGDPRWLDRDFARRMAGPTMAARHRAEAKQRAKSEVLAKRRADKVFCYLKALCVTARKNAGKRSLDFTIDDDWLWDAYLKCEGRCSVTGIAFDLNRHGSTRAPYAPSLDRVNCSVGYTPENVRIVCQIANLAMNVWGSDILARFIADARL